MNISTTTSIILTQVPIAIAILYAVIEVKKARDELIAILNKLADESNKKKK